MVLNTICNILSSQFLVNFTLQWLWRLEEQCLNFVRKMSWCIQFQALSLSVTRTNL